MAETPTSSGTKDPNQPDPNQPGETPTPAAATPPGPPRIGASFPWQEFVGRWALAVGLSACCGAVLGFIGGSVLPFLGNAFGHFIGAINGAAIGLLVGPFLVRKSMTTSFWRGFVWSAVVTTVALILSWVWLIPNGFDLDIVGPTAWLIYGVGTAAYIAGLIRAHMTRPDVWPVVPPGLCITCRYDIRGLAPDAPCPECGQTQPKAITA